jgi:D-xylose transport system permease protein
MSDQTTSTTPATPTTSATPPPKVTMGDVVSGYFAKVRGGDVGSLPAILGLIALVIIFSALKPGTFTNAFNFANLISQAAAIVVLAMGLVFVLLLGEIDLSAGVTGGTAASILAITATRHDWPAIPALLACLATGALIGTLMGLLVSRLGIPSFVVTLAAFLGLQGVMLALIGEGGTVGIRNEWLLKLNNDTLPVWLGWVLAAIGLLAYAGLTLRTLRRRQARGLVADPMILWVIKVTGLTVLVVAVVGYLSQERSRNPLLISLKGVPVVLVIIVGLLIVLTFMLSKTAWGRHVYAVGGNAEAARRAGINVAWIKLSCFIMCSTLAAVAGVLIASRDNGVSPTTGGGTTLLYAVGAAVIGGTSLFGGKGRIVDALVGGLVIAVIDNGMILLNQPPGTVYMVTGGVLLLAASVDAISRRRASASGRA